MGNNEMVAWEPKMLPFLGYFCRNKGAEYFWKQECPPKYRICLMFRAYTFLLLIEWLLCTFFIIFYILYLQCLWILAPSQRNSLRWNTLWYSSGILTAFPQCSLMAGAQYTHIVFENNRAKNITQRIWIMHKVVTMVSRLELHGRR